MQAKVQSTAAARELARRDCDKEITNSLALTDYVITASPIPPISAPPALTE
jgi:hypothetical protein